MCVLVHMICGHGAVIEIIIELGACITDTHACIIAIEVEF